MLIKTAIDKTIWSFKHSTRLMARFFLLQVYNLILHSVSVSLLLLMYTANVYIYKWTSHVRFLQGVP